MGVKPVQSDKYVTKDLWLSAFLKHKGFIPKLQAPVGNKIEILFSFENSQALRGFAEQFFAGSVTVNLVDLRTDVKELRQWLDEAKTAQFS